MWDRPQLTLDYAFDSEFRIGSGRNPAALPLVDREVHSASVGVTKSLARSLELSGAAGYAVDRLGGSSPFFSVNARYAPRGHLGAQALYDRRLYLLGTARTVTTFGAGLWWRF
jgi:hypothetical protein